MLVTQLERWTLEKVLLAQAHKRMELVLVIMKMEKMMVKMMVMVMMMVVKSMVKMMVMLLG